ncbi:MAG: response regulator [Candidatus Altiarchaeota archaeon]|nr:response regulator [Candidatus Altiarchaeota archaeon]
MATTQLKARAAAPHRDALMDYNPQDLVYNSLSPERREMFHKKRRILIIDDMASTCKRLHADLSKIYPEDSGNAVEYETDPIKARDRIIASKQAGRPYDALVLDLFMEGLQGAQLMKDIHTAGAFVPVVINTASMMDPVVSGIAKQFDEFRTRKAMEDWHARNRKHFPRPVLFHDKLDGTLSSLTDMLDVAMLVGRQGLGDTDAFLREFNPALVEKWDFSAEVTHKIAEETHNCAVEVSGILKEMGREFPGFKKTAWWKRSQGRVVETLREFGGVSFRTTYAGKPEETGNRLHRLANLMVFINGPDAERLAMEGVGEYARNPKFKDAVALWNESVRGPYRMISQLFAGYREHYKPEVNVPVFVRELVGGAGTVESPYENLVVHGDKQSLQELVSVPVQVAKKRVADNPGSSMKVRIDYTKDIAGSKMLREDERSRLQGIGCGRCCLVEVTDDAPSPASVDKAYGDFIYKLGGAKEAGVAIHSVENPKKGGLKMRILLNLDAKRQE